MIVSAWTCTCMQENGREMLTQWQAKLAATVDRQKVHQQLY